MRDDGEIDENDASRNQHDAALQGRIVTPANGFDQPLANAGPGEKTPSRKATAVPAMTGAAAAGKVFGLAANIQI